MKLNVPSHDRETEAKLVAEELARFLCDGEWHDYEALAEAAGDLFCEGSEDAPCRELLRLHVYGRLQNWVHHGWVEQKGGEYRITGETVRELNEHAAAEHCQELLARVVATGKAFPAPTEGEE